MSLLAISAYLYYNKEKYIFMYNVHVHVKHNTNNKLQLVFINIIDKNYKYK